MTSLNENNLELIAPSIPQANPNFPGSQYNLMSITSLNPLKVGIPLWPDSDKAERMVLTISIGRDQQPPEDVATYTFYGPLDSTVFPFLGDILAEHLALEGVYQVSYRVEIAGNTQNSATNQFTIDRTAPNNNLSGASPIFPPEVIDEGITREYLELHDDEVPVTIPVYSDQREGDVVLLYFGNFIESPVLRATVSDSTSPTVVHLSGDVIRERGNGNKFAYYTLEDRADNAGQKSQSKTIPVSLS